MTGEMVKPPNAEKGEAYWKDKRGTWGRILGDDAYLIRPNYPDHFEICDKLKRSKIKCSVEPFDVYQGAYIYVEGQGLKIWRDNQSEFDEYLIEDMQKKWEERFIEHLDKDMVVSEVKYILKQRKRRK